MDWLRINSAWSAVDFPLALTPVKRLSFPAGITTSAPKHLKFPSRNSLSTTFPQYLISKTKADSDLGRITSRLANCGQILR